jgi:ATP-dependent DNA helicase RecG
VHVSLLTGKDKAKKRESTLIGLMDGSVQMVIGTHALFQDQVAFRNLGFVIIDEQHRFGVQQRLKLSAKGKAVDSLAMTATPIPRTLVMSWYGDMDVSLLTDKPAGRKPVTTNTLSLDHTETVIARLAQAISRGEKAYWICPLVEESELSDLAAAQERYGLLQRRLGDDQIGLLHGKMTPEDKAAVMEQFQKGRIRVLVATTVVEVGVDVPDATIMIIEHAEQFGLSQLHQLRGRVGRSDKPSSCLLLFKAPLGDVARARLEAMRRTQDGFVIAEEDLRLRGQGDLLGTKQSGMPHYRFANLQEDSDLLALAMKDARWIVEEDPFLEKERGQALKNMLYLFGRDNAIRLTRAG